MELVTLTPFVVFSFTATVALAIFGGSPERWASLLLTGVLVITPLIQAGEWWYVPLSSLVVFIALFVMALTRDRWWLIFAAGCQLLALSTHIISLIRLDELMWSAVTIRWLSWLILMLLAIFGAWEGRALKRL